MQKFLDILRKNSKVYALDDFLKNGQKSEFKVLSFGLFSPLAQLILTAKGVREAHILHPFIMDSESQSLDSESSTSANADSHAGHSFFDLHFHTYEIGTEHAVAALLALLDSENLDFGYISSESNISEEEASAVRDFLRAPCKKVILLGRDAYLHEHCEFLAHNFAKLADEFGAEIYLQDLPQSVDRAPCTGDFAPDFGILDDLPENNGAFAYECKDFELAALESVLFGKMLARKKDEKDYLPFKRVKDYEADLLGADSKAGGDFGASSAGQISESKSSESAQTLEFAKSSESTPCAKQKCAILFAPSAFGAIFKVYADALDYDTQYFDATLEDDRSAKMCFVEMGGTIGALQTAEINSYPFKQIVDVKKP